MFICVDYAFAQLCNLNFKNLSKVYHFAAEVPIVVLRRLRPCLFERLLVLGAPARCAGGGTAPEEPIIFSSNRATNRREGRGERPARPSAAAS